MQVKKFEAETIQEALESVKRELGPEAVILQTKNNRRGFGLLSKPSVEVTAAVSGRAIGKKKTAERKIPKDTRHAIQRLAADKQAKIYDKYMQGQLIAAEGQKERVQLTSARKLKKKAPIPRYADIPNDADIETIKVSGESALSRTIAKFSDIRRDKTDASATRQELQQLKKMVLDLKKDKEKETKGSGSQSLLGSETFSTMELHDAFEELVVNGVDKKFALQLIRQVSRALDKDDHGDPELVKDQLAEELIEKIEIQQVLEGIQPFKDLDSIESSPVPTVIALVGPTGVGKTTTIAKIASEAILKHQLRVALINIDSYKIAATDQLGAYAKILNVPFRTVADTSEIKYALEEFKKIDLILIDTTGRSQKDATSLAEMHLLLKEVPNVQVKLVLSATTRDVELYDIGKRFSIFRPGALIVSKLDEATIFGSILNVSNKLKLPLAYFTTGQRVPEDIESATQERLAALIMEI